MESKKCPKCKVKLPYTEYTKSAYRANAYCKPCMSTYYKQRTERNKKRKGNAWWV